MTITLQLAEAARKPRCGLIEKWRFKGLSVVLLALWVVTRALPGSNAIAQTLPEGLTPEATARVITVIDGDTLVLDDGRQVRLVGIQAPKLALGRPDFVDWPLAEEARDMLAALAMDRTVSLAFGGLPEDRHGRLLAHLVRDDGLWLQGAMLAAGMARVYSFADNRSGISEMLALEGAARDAALGIWDLPYYAIRSASEPLADAVDSFQLVEGTVLDAARVRGRYFLNFGADYRDDFTVTVAPGDAGLFNASTLDLLGLEGRRIRVRGWIGLVNGPQIEADHPEQIELIGP